MLQNTGTTEGGKKRCASTRSVQFSGNHHKYYIGWAFVISCSLKVETKLSEEHAASSYTAQVSSVGTQTHYIRTVQERANQIHMSSREDNGKQDK